jgi:hypothetical protein
MKLRRRGEEQEPSVAGFGVLDDKGRLSLSKPVRRALGLHPGSSVAYVVVGNALLLIPQDEHLSALFDRAAGAWDRLGITDEELEERLQVARDEVVRELYGAEFMEALAREHTAALEEPDGSRPQ